MRRSGIFAIAAAALAVAGGVGWHLAGPRGDVPAAQAADQPAARPAVAVEAEKVAVRDLVREISAVGTLRSDESVVVRPEVAGRIVEIAFEEGTSVAKGDLLFKLDDSTLRAELARAQANMVLAEKNNERAQELLSRGAGTARNRDEARAIFNVSQGTIAEIRAQLGKTVINAPFGGMLGLRHVSPGDYVAAGTDLVNLESIDPLKVDFRIPEVHLGELEVGQRIRVQVDAFPDERYEGHVTAVDPRIDPEGRSIVIRATLPNPVRRLRPGLFARVELLVERRANALLVPEEALVPRGNDQFVYKVVDGKAVQVPVRIGLRRQGMAEILEGLAAGDLIVTAGHLKLRPGAAVSVEPPAGPMS